jgi:hypothetical protein
VIAAMETSGDAQHRPGLVGAGAGLPILARELLRRR